MNGVVQAAQGIMERYRWSVDHADVGFDRRSEMKNVLRLLPVADFYEIDRDMSLYLNDLKDESTKGCKTLTDIRLPVDSRPPSDVCFVYLTNNQSAFLVQRYEAGSVQHTFEPANGHPVVLITWAVPDAFPLVLGGHIVSDREESNQMFVTQQVREKASKGLEDYAANATVFIALLMCLINQPRFVVRDAAGSRQSRKHMHRKHGISTGAWHKIQWNLGEPVRAKTDSDRGGWRMPLHYTRGHWRKAQDHWDDVVIRKDNQPYKWIDGFWSGHPAYGVKKSYHAPKRRTNPCNMD